MGKIPTYEVAMRNLRVADITTMMWYLLMAADKGGKVSVNEIKKALDAAHIGGPDIVDFLRERVGNEPHSLYDAEDKKQTRLRLHSVFDDMSRAVNEKHDLGVSNEGLLVLLAYCVETIQRLTRL